MFQELLKLKVDLFKHYEDFILTSVKLESHQDHLAVEQLKCRKAQVLSAWSDLENKVML